MDNLEDKSTKELQEEYEQLHKTYYDLKDRMLKAYDFLKVMEVRGKKIIDILEKRTGSIDGQVFK